MLLSIFLTKNKKAILQIRLSLISISYALIGLLSGVFSPSYAGLYPTVWDAMRPQMQLDHQTNRPEVQKQIQWLKAHPGYLDQLSLSEPYMFHIVNEIRKKGLPGELALLPLIESAFDPFSYSKVGAAGLWQFMPETAKDLGLRKDWWVDNRRSITPSTEAALNYLSYLRDFFDGNWTLAIAAYDCGEGRMSKVLRARGQTATHANYWQLPLPTETKNYIPRLYALAEIIKNPEAYDVTLPDIPHKPYFEEVKIQSQIDLNKAAKLAGMTYNELIHLNPGFNRWTTAPHKPVKLLIPTDRIQHFTHNLAKLPNHQRASFTKHHVQPGETLELIAHKYFTTERILQELNQLAELEVKTGQVLMIPSQQKITALAKTISESVRVAPKLMPKTLKVVHIVQAHESIHRIAEKYGVDEAAIRRWNRIPENSPLRYGAALTIWKNTTNRKVYTVQHGDSLGRIAQIFNTKVSTLLKYNPHINVRLLKPGQRIVLG